eukprot:6467398-Amphidinium_carterae.2
MPVAVCCVEHVEVNLDPISAEAIFSKLCQDKLKRRFAIALHLQPRHVLEESHLGTPGLDPSDGLEEQLHIWVVLPPCRVAHAAKVK